MKVTTEQDKTLVLEGFDTLFNKRDYVAAESFCRRTTSSTALTSRRAATDYFNLVKTLPPALKYEHGTIVADGEFVIIHGRLSGFQSVSRIAADILHINDGVLLEHWDVIQDEATKEQSKSGLQMFGDKFSL
jgi:predicted SnoaL-like aldol condensation-catalyzing enzyme